MAVTQEQRKVAQDLMFWIQGQDFFTCKLFSLLGAADGYNQDRLAKAFPVEVEVWRDWRASDVNEFKARYGVR